VTLCLNDHERLRLTLAAMPAASVGLQMPLEILVLDGSEGTACAQVCIELANGLGLPLRYEHRKPEGIYLAMNEALELANGELVAFMHAGDLYLPGGLTDLINHWLALAEHAVRPVAVFGQAWVQPITGAGSLRPWLTPPASIRHLRRWLGWMVPCHQAFVFEINFARAHPYGCRSLVADRAVMRIAIAQAGPACFLPRPVCVYGLDGVSSRLPTSEQLFRRLEEAGRTPAERLAELLKWALLRLGLAPHQSRLMRLRASLWGWICSLP
jgi:glycosyltransferase involved in cell wall biosynthesis